MKFRLNLEFFQYYGWVIIGVSLLGFLTSFFSSSIGIMPITTVLSNWFKKYRGTALTIAFIGIGASKLFAGPIE